ncbi:hypothetical protein G5714_010288 [Onychostoma macrolepis]|uniref:Uncharacterized protein n=1 Tax=Onychostoma macrolepis TaxID=369639 RepID=A0A7J6CRJ2_9TELE|nr:hypothetical protein G5714_010288 [Onychostoma macrolepis]
MDVGILIIPDGDDALDYYVVLEEQIALRDAIDLPHAAALLVGLIFALNIDYPKKLRYTFEVIQKIFIDLGALLDIRNSIVDTFTNSYTPDMDCSFGNTKEPFRMVIPECIRRWPLNISRRKRRRKRGNRGGYIVRLKAQLRAGFLSDYESFYGVSATWRPLGLTYRWLCPVLPLHPSPASRAGLHRIGLGSRRRGLQCHLDTVMACHCSDSTASHNTCSQQLATHAVSA